MRESLPSYGRSGGRNSSKGLESEDDMTIAAFLRSLRPSLRKRLAYFAFGISLISLAPFPSFGKGPTTKITLESAHLFRPIEITDPAIIKDFPVFSGPGASGRQSTSLIVDWAAGPVTPKPGLESYRVSFHLQEYPRPYVVLYAPDPSGKVGYVYLPGKHDAVYSTNVAIIYRGVEGNWFRALPRWEDLARPLIEKELKLELRTPARVMQTAIASRLNLTVECTGTKQAGQTDFCGGSIPSCSRFSRMNCSSRS
jgi:hypothetical protein